MSKGKSTNNEHVSIRNNDSAAETLCASSIISILLKEGKVVIPELGYLELKVFPNKQTVLFKATGNTSLFLAAENSIQSHIYNNVSVPLKGRKVVNLPGVGIFQPMKNADGSLHVSYTISSSLRKLLNGVEDDKIPATQVRAEEEKTLAPVVDVHDWSDKSEGQKETAENGEKTGEEAAVSTPEQENRITRKTPSYLRSVAKVGDLVVPQEKKGNILTGAGGVIAAVVALIALFLLAWYFFSQSKNKYQDDPVFVSNNNQTESTREANGSAQSGKSFDLPSLSEQKYGNRAFWVYIYDANRDKISSPVNIPEGTDLRIPNLWEDYKVDVTDSMEIKRAGIFSEIVLKQKI